MTLLTQLDSMCQQRIYKEVVVKKILLVFLTCLSSMNAAAMIDLLSENVPMRADGKISIPEEIKHVKLDIGLSYNAPMSQHWLSHESDLIVFGFEPNPESVQSIKQGAVKKHRLHGDPLEIKYIGSRFFIIPCALELQSGETKTFYVTKRDCGTSSLYKPIKHEVEKVIDVPVFRLSDFLDHFPFDTHPVIDFIKIDAQGADLDIVRSIGNYLHDRVVYITLEATEKGEYHNTKDSHREVVSYMLQQGFIPYNKQKTSDPTFVNPRFIEYARDHNVIIFQKG